MRVVEFVKKEIVKIDRKIIKQMKDASIENGTGKFRYCFHENENANMQEMMFVVSKEGYARPHKHISFAESQIIIDGEGYAVLFDDDGLIIDSFLVSKEDNLFYRIEKGIWHMLIPISDKMVVYEVREGKFERESSIFPEWAPACDEEAISIFKNRILGELERR